MAISCETIWRQSSEYLDGTLGVNDRIAMDQHIQSCPKCASVIDGLRNIISLYGDERMAELPVGFSQRLHQKIEASVPPTRRSFLGWTVAFAASVLVVGGIELSHFLGERESAARSKEKRHALKPVPPDLQVVVTPEGKLFHLATCPLVANQSPVRAMTAGAAIAQGLTPCPRCLSEYL